MEIGLLHLTRLVISRPSTGHGLSISFVSFALLPKSCLLDCLLENLANKEIANKLNISERTVKFHVSNLLAKYKVQRRADLILLSYQRQNQAA
jgi:hypothetical protein